MEEVIEVTFAIVFLSGSENTGRQLPPLLGSDPRWMPRKNWEKVSSRVWRSGWLARWKEHQAAVWGILLESRILHKMSTLRFVHLILQIFMTLFPRLKIQLLQIRLNIFCCLSPVPEYSWKHICSQMKEAARNLEYVLTLLSHCKMF